MPRADPAQRRDILRDSLILPIDSVYTVCYDRDMEPKSFTTEKAARHYVNRSEWKRWDIYSAGGKCIACPIAKPSDWTYSEAHARTIVPVLSHEAQSFARIAALAGVTFETAISGCMSAMRMGLAYPDVNRNGNAYGAHKR